jgi:hypothetical protein
MAFTEALSTGFPVTMVQNQVYALPSRKCTLFSNAGGTIEQANDVGFGTPKAVTLDTNNEATVVGGFIRQTAAAGGLTITLKKD